MKPSCITCRRLKCSRATNTDLVSTLTLTNVAEAIGFVRGHDRVPIPAVVSFTVETDGELPAGMTLSDAITVVDDETDGATAYFMINCSHPDHFSPALDQQAPALDRVRGVHANASRLSHAELDESPELDDGHPDEFGIQMIEVHDRRPGINILGGCCGTDARHIAAIAQAYEVRRQRP